MDLAFHSNEPRDLSASVMHNVPFDLFSHSFEGSVRKLGRDDIEGKIRVSGSKSVSCTKNY